MVRSEVLSEDISPALKDIKAARLMEECGDMRGTWSGETQHELPLAIGAARFKVGNPRRRDDN